MISSLKKSMALSISMWAGLALGHRPQRRSLVHCLENQQTNLARDILIGKDGLGKWSRIAAPSEQASAISISGSTLWRLYDENFVLVASGSAEGKASLPKSAGGSWLVTYGAPGSTIELRLIPIR